MAKIELKKGFVIDTNDYKTFEDFYQLGIKLEENGFVDKGFASAKQKSSGMEPKYLNWATITRILKVFDPNVEKVVRQFPRYIVKNGESVEVGERPYFTEGKVNFVEVGIKFKEQTYYTIQPIMTVSFQDVDVVQGTRVNYTIQRGYVKAIAEHIGLGLHLWTKEEVNQPKEVTTRKPKPKAKAKTKPNEEVTIETTKPKPTENTTVQKTTKTTENSITKAQQDSAIAKIKDRLAMVPKARKEEATIKIKEVLSTFSVNRMMELPLISIPYEQINEILSLSIPQKEGE